MARAYEKYMQTFGVKGFEHPDIEFVTKNGLNVVLIWNKSEYRAYKKSAGDTLTEMHLGGVLPEHLQKYIAENF